MYKYKDIAFRVIEKEDLDFAVEQVRDVVAGVKV